MSLISVTREERNGRASSSSDLIQTDRLSEAIREIGGKAYISVIESPLTGRGSENLVIGRYLVTESLATVVAQSNDLFSATVVTRDGKTPASGYSSLGFVASKIMGPIETEGSGSKFLYHEDNTTHPVIYIVSEAPSAIIAQTGTGGAVNTIFTSDGAIVGNRTITSDGVISFTSDYANGEHTIIDGVKEYVALLTQSGTAAPVATVLRNDLGTTITWGRTATGGYTATAGAAIFDAAKTILIGPANGNNVGDYGLGIASSMQVFNFYRSSDTVLNLGTGNLATATGVVTASDSNLYGSNMVIIRVYP